MVWSEMKKRGFELGKQRKDDYVNLLLQKESRGIPGDDKLLHKLMICALIEARSCERFRLLSERLEEESLRKFYYKFMISEAGHYRMFIDLAEKYYPEQKVREVWQHWLAIEGEVLTELSPRGDRMH
jgi:tRNA-(ms[2]io[6]A)-hydroxylase